MTLPGTLPLMLLEGKKGVVLNVTNKNSIGWHIADRANQEGAVVGVGAQNERMLEGVQKLIEGRSGLDTLIADFTFEEQYEALAQQVAEKYGELDFLVHAVGYAPKEALEGRFIDTSLADFQTAMSASAYSFVRLCKTMEPLLKEDASVITLSYIGSTRAMGGYKVMGMAKAALEAATRYLAIDLGARGIRVNTISPGPLRTVSGMGVGGLKDFMKSVQESAPLKRPYTQHETAGAALYLLSDLSQGVTGQILFVDSGYNVMAL